MGYDFICQLETLPVTFPKNINLHNNSGKNMTIKDIARLAGVSVSTVSRVLNNHPDVSEKAKESVLAVVEKYNYIPKSINRIYNT